MFRITRQTDYGILLLARMASLPPDRILTAKDAASWACLPVPMVSKILKSMVRAGLVLSHRGVKGGYGLAVGADRIPIRQVIEALEGPIGLTECSAHPGRCEQEGSCPTKLNWQRINVAIRKALEEVVVADMLAPDTGRLIHVENVATRPATTP